MSQLDLNALVLVVDDDPLQRLIRINQLRAFVPDDQIVCADGADQAKNVLMLRRLDVKLVITDLDMPGLGDGKELIRWLRPSNVTTQIPIIIVSENMRAARRLKKLVNAVWSKADTLSDPAGFADCVKKLLGIP